jgi:hypothetical protein
VVPNQQANIHFSMDRGVKIMNYKELGVEFASYRMSYKILRGRWCDTVLNVHALTEDKADGQLLQGTRTFIQ